jgi:hypothetical protein
MAIAIYPFSISENHTSAETFNLSGFRLIRTWPAMLGCAKSKGREEGWGLGRNQAVGTPAVEGTQ